jgi:hypothetical protein
MPILKKMYMPHIYNNEFLKLKNMDWLSIYVFLYMHFCVWFLFEISYMDSIYNILKWYNINEKNC